MVEKFWVDTGSGVEEVTNTVAWEYDELNRLIDEIFVTDADDLLDPVSLPEGTRAWTDYADHYTYDLTGNRLEKTTDLGNDTSIDEAITYEYDSNDRLLQEVKDVASGTDTTTQYSFDRTQQTSKEVYEGLPGSLGDIQSSQSCRVGRDAPATFSN